MNPDKLGFVEEHTSFDAAGGNSGKTLPGQRPPIAILGVPFDNVSTVDALERIEEMIAGRDSHYVVTANVDFLTQARKDVELRRILLDANLVLCDGTPLLWASRFLGNPLAERVAGSDLVPLLIERAARKNYRLFFLGSTPEAGAKAMANLKERYPQLEAVHYSPPFNKLLEMDHAEITARIHAARPDVLLVSFGCPKQEKWIAMHYRNLGVPVSIGVGATIDFIAGAVRRAPKWMQQCGMEWVFRLAQEPGRLAGRYAQDFWFFGGALATQLWVLRSLNGKSNVSDRDEPGEAEPRGPGAPCARKVNGPIMSNNHIQPSPVPEHFRHSLPRRFDFAAIVAGALHESEIMSSGKHCILDLSRVEFIDSSGIGALVGLHKRLRVGGRKLILLAPPLSVRQALRLMRLESFFHNCDREEEIPGFLRKQDSESVRLEARPAAGDLKWADEVTAATVRSVQERSLAFLDTAPGGQEIVVDMSEVTFIDSSGLGLMLRVKKEAEARGLGLRFTGLQPAVRNVLQIAHLEKYFQTDQVGEVSNLPRMIPAFPA